MTSWNTIPDADIDAESPITESLMFRLRDNLIAHMEGDASVPATIDGHHFKSVQSFDSSTTWNRPTGINFILVITQAGGGGGGSPDSFVAPRMSSGGGGGAYSEKLIDVTAIASVTVTIGGGGANGSPNSDGSNGGDSAFVGHTLCDAGEGGDRYAWGEGNGGNRPSDGGYLRIGGQNSAKFNNNDVGSSDGGGSHMGQGGYAGANADANNAEFYGAGGGGVEKDLASPYEGGNGKGGIIIVMEYT